MSKKRAPRRASLWEETFISQMHIKGLCDEAMEEGPRTVQVQARGPVGEGTASLRERLHVHPAPTVRLPFPTSLLSEEPAHRRLLVI